MKILVVTQLYPISEESEDSKAIHYFVKEWSKNHEVKVLRPYYPYEKEKKLDSSNVIIEGIRVDVFSPIWVPILKVSLYNPEKILKKINFRPDIIVAHLYHSYINFSKLSNQLKIPIIVGIHKSDIRLLSNYLHRNRISNAIKRGDAIAFRSIPLKSKVEKMCKRINAPTFVAFSGIPEEYIQNALKLQLDVAGFGKKKRFISACQLIKLKQIDKVIFALKAADDKGFTNWEYTVIGNGPEMDKLKRMVKDYHFEEKIFFKGRLTRDEVFKEFNSHDIFVMPSYKETFGIAYLEAMASGCIVIGAKGWGIDGVVSHKHNGFLCDPYSQPSIANNIEAVFKAKNELLLKIREESLKTIVGFSEQKMAENYLNFINSIFKKNKESVD